MAAGSTISPARRRRDAAGRKIRRGRIEHGANRIGRWRRNDRWPFRQVIERIELRRLDGLKLQMPLRQRLDTAGRVELAPFGAQGRDGVALAANFPAQLGYPLDLQRGVELDLVNNGRRQNERADHKKVDKAHGQRPPTTSSRAGNRGTASSSPCRAGAFVRSAARSLAERARAFLAISFSSGVTGRLVSTSNVGDDRLTSGA